MIACMGTTERLVAPDEVLPGFDGSMEELVARITARDVEGLWLSTGVRTKLSIELSPCSAVRQVSYIDKGCGSYLTIDALTVRSPDDVVLAQVPARLALQYPQPGQAMLLATLPTLPSEYTGPALWPLDEPRASGQLAAYDIAAHSTDGSPGLYVSYQLDSSPAELLAGIYDDGRVLGIWSTREDDLPSGPPTLYTPDALVTNACVGAESFQSNSFEATPFPSIAAATAGISGTWARCTDSAPSSHAGLQILPDGTWRDFTIEAGELVARSGFEHEGFLGWNPLGSPIPNLFQASLLPMGRHPESHRSSWDDVSMGASDRALVFPGGPEGWPAAVYLPTTLPVRATPPEYADGERAGAAACTRTEHGIVPTLEESATLLSGDFVLCSGSLHGGVTRLHFGPTSVELQNADGGILATLSTEVSTMNAPRLGLALTGADPDARSWSVIVSRQPLKLLIAESSFGPTSTAVFSAMP